MPRLKSRHEFPPNGWKFYQPQTQWTLPGNLSFDGAVNAIITHRKQRAPFLKQFKLSTDYNAVGNELDEYNAVRCINAGHNHFVASFGSVDYQFSPPETKSLNDVSSRIEAVTSWLGEGMRPVPKELSIHRANTCVRCPNNVSFDEGENALTYIKDRLQLNLPQDHLLKKCRITNLPLSLNVHVEIGHIINH